ncbi:hypothetical protein AB0K48_46315 [Nonomuraea sp. NPDC055795]
MRARKIVVADDHLHWASQWGRLLQEHRKDQYIVIPVATPKKMSEVLEEDPDVWLAVIDMDFGRASPNTGLGALLAAEQHARRRPKERELHTIITTVEDTDDRILFLHAAFQCFEPPPVDLIYKDNDFTAAVLDAVGHLSTGGRPGPHRYRRFKPVHDQEPLIRRLLGGPRTEDGVAINLAIWQALSGLTTQESDSVRGVQSLLHATGFSSKHIYHYLDAAFNTASLLACDMRFAPRALLDPPKPARAGDKIGALREFASIHALFFKAPELDDITKRLLDPVRGKGRRSARG